MEKKERKKKETHCFSEMPVEFLLPLQGLGAGLGGSPPPRGTRLTLSKGTSPFRRLDPILFGAKTLSPLEGAERKQRWELQLGPTAAAAAVVWGGPRDA